MTQIYEPGRAALELRRTGYVEALPQELVREAKAALETWSSPEGPSLAATLDAWLDQGTEFDVPPTELSVCSEKLAVAAHEVTSELGQLGRLVASMGGRIVGGGGGEQIVISSLAVLSLALRRFALIGGHGCRIVHPGQ